MATIKRLARFLPTPPPQNIPVSLQEWLREEFDRLASASNGALDSIDAIAAIPLMVLSGDADNFNLNVTPQQFVNYSQGGAVGEVPVDPDFATGIMTVPVGGAYRLSAFVIGLQGNVQQNASIFLLITVNGLNKTVYSIDVDGVQTDVRALAVTLTRVFQTDDIVTMSLSATHDMGLFTVQETSLEMRLITTNVEGLDLNF